MSLIISKYNKKTKIERIKYTYKMVLVFFHEGMFIILLCNKKQNYHETPEHKIIFLPIRLLW